MRPLLIFISLLLFKLMPIGGTVKIPSFSTTNDSTQWISMAGKLTVQLQVHGLDSGPQVSWLVEEYVSLKDDIAYSHHTSLDTGDSFELLAHGLRNYYYSSGPNRDDDCRLDHRQDQLTLYPWRHLTRQLGIEVGPLVVGVLAVWLNAIDQKAACNLDSKVLTCQLVDERRMVRANLTFDWPEVDDGYDDDDDDSHRAKLRKVHVRNQQTVHLDRTSLLQDTNVDVDISLMERSGAIDGKLNHRIQKLVENCRESIPNSETIFPSLMRQIAESHKRNYWFSYSVSLYGPLLADGLVAGGGQPLVTTFKEKFKYQEHFSYELGRQSIVRSASSANDSEPEVRFDSLFKFQNPETHTTLAYRSTTKPHECLIIEEIDDPLGSLSIMTRRTMRFMDRNHPDREMPRGALLGLGALLMNAADIRSKSSQEDGFTVSRGNKWPKSIVEWIMEDQIEGLQFHFYLLPRQRGQQQNYFTDVADLVKIEVKKYCYSNLNTSQDNSRRRKGKQLDSDQICASQVLMVVDILDFSTNLDPAELDEAFVLPYNCPPTMQFQPAASSGDNQQQPGEDNEDTTPSSTVQEENPTGELDYEFPAFEQFIELSRDYSMISDWDLSNQQNLFELREHQKLGLDEERLLNRIDVNGLIDHVGSYKLYVNRSTTSTMPDGPMYRVEENECKRVDHMDKWLENLAYDSPTFLGHRLYGVRGLWTLASQSPYVEYLGKFDKQPTWRLAEEPRLMNMSALFRFIEVGLFKNGQSATMYHSLRLNSIEIDCSKSAPLQHLNPIRIYSIQFRARDNSTFALPDCCAQLLQEQPIDIKFNTESSSNDDHFTGSEDDTGGDTNTDEPTFKFPSFENEFGGVPSKVTFIMRYNYVINLDNTSVAFEAIEAHKIQGLGRLELRPANSQKAPIKVWITEEGQSLLEEPAGGRCRQVQRLAEFMLMEEFLNILGDDQPELYGPRDFSNFALANVWELFGARVEAEQDHHGQLPGRVEFRYLKRERQAQWMVNGQNNETTIIFIFRHDSHKKEGQNLVLQTILLKSMASGNMEELIKFELLDASGLFVEQSARFLPEECSRCLEKVYQFPSLIGLLHDRHGIIHIRSESISNYSFEGHTMLDGDGSKFYLLDEYYDQKLGRFRSRSGHLRHNFDHLIYNSTREFFDLSQEFQCQTVAPSASSSNETADWILDNLFAADHYGSFHGPLALWLLAFRPHMKMELAFDEWDILSWSDPSAIDDDNDNDDWFSYQSWKITHQFNDRIAYRMQFATKTTTITTTDTSGVGSISLPVRIESRNWFQVSSSTRTPSRRRQWRRNGLIVADVIHLVDHFDPQELRIPIGHGCKRNEAARQEIRRSKMDLMVFDPLSPVEFEYEASLQLIDMTKATEGAVFVPIPVVHSGWFGRCPGLAPFGLLSINHQRSHYIDGTMSSQKLLITSESLESENHLRRLLDERTGVCSIWQEYQSPSQVLTLNFSKIDGRNGSGQINTEHEQLVVIDSSLLRLLGTVSDELEQIQLFNLTGGQAGKDAAAGVEDLITQVVYEKRLDEFSLNGQLKGPTSIVRTFERSWADKQQRGRPIFHVHHSVKLEVLVLGKARLTLQMKRLYYRDCANIFTKADTENCYQSTDMLHYDNSLPPSEPKESKLRSFSMKMSLVDNGGNDDHYNGWKRFEWFRVMLRQEFVKRLLELNKHQLKPAQLGQIHLEDTGTSNHEIVVKFNLMEPPEAIEYFTKIPGISLKTSSGLAPKTIWAQRIVRILSTKFACSRWCDSLECLAFSYCQSDRSCQVVRYNYSVESGSGTDDNLDQYPTNGFGFGLDDNKSCDYYHAPEEGGRRRVLRETIDLIRAQVDGLTTDGVGNFTLKVPASRKPDTKPTILIAASEFTEITPDGLGLFDAQTNESARGMADKQPAYTMLKATGSIEAYTVERLGLEGGEIMHTWTLADCFEKCSANNCRLLSYCDQRNLCTTLGKIKDWSTLKQVIGMEQQKPPFDNQSTSVGGGDDCAIYSVDFLLDYREFDGTTKPENYEHEVENVSVLECAAICELGLGTTGMNAGEHHSTGSGSFECLSFDYCVEYSAAPAAKTRTRSSKCYLQRMHILMDSFDESIMEQQPTKQIGNNTSGPTDSDGGDNSIRCSHHSKSLLSDYDLLSGKRFAEHRSLVFEGTEVDLCALICRQDDTCLAFEHCHHKLEREPNSCYIRRQSQDESDLVQRDYHADELELDAECSVFKAKHFSEEFKFEPGQNMFGAYEPNYNNNWLEQIASQGHFKVFIEIALVLGALFGAMVMGSLIHIMYIMLTGDRLPLFQ